MRVSLLAEFEDPATLIAAARHAASARFPIADIFTPFELEEAADLIETGSSHVRLWMLVTAVAAAAAAYGLQWYSAVIDYPVNAGGRPLHSWPVFLFVPFELSMFLAAVAGLAAMSWTCGLPRLNDPVFDVSGFERATQDRFFLLSHARADDVLRLREILRSAGAVMVSEVHAG